MVPFDMLGSVSYYCLIVVTLSVKLTVFQIFDYKKCANLEIQVRGHSKSLKVVSFDRFGMVSY